MKSKDDIIAELETANQALLETIKSMQKSIDQLNETIRELTEKLNKNSQNNGSLTYLVCGEEDPKSLPVAHSLSKPYNQ